MTDCDLESVSIATKVRSWTIPDMGERPGRSGRSRLTLSRHRPDRSPAVQQSPTGVLSFGSRPGRAQADSEHFRSAPQALHAKHPQPLALPNGTIPLLWRQEAFSGSVKTGAA